jgi:hypothetical protein
MSEVNTSICREHGLERRAKAVRGEIWRIFEKIFRQENSSSWSVVRVEAV